LLYPSIRVRTGLLCRLGLGFWVGLDLRSWLFTHSWRSDAINFLLAYCQIADLTLSIWASISVRSPRSDANNY